MNKQPEVTARTRQSFIDAFWKLYRDNPVEKIRIEALSKEAGFNRTTFYEYFLDIYDILQQAEDRLIDEYRASLHALFPEGVKEAAKEDIMKAVVTLFDKYGDRIFILTGQTGDSSFSSRLEEQALPLMHAMLGTDAGAYTNYIVAFVYNAISGVIKYWYNSGKQLAEEELLSLIYGILTEGAMKTALSLCGS